MYMRHYLSLRSHSSARRALQTGVCKSAGRLAGWLLLALGLASCQARRPEFATPYPYAKDPASLTPLSLEEGARMIQARHGEWETFQAQADVVVDSGRGRGKQSFNAQLLARLPDKARLRGSRPAIGPLFDLISDGDTLHVYFNREGALFSGPLEDLGPETGVLREAHPATLVSALLAQRDLALRLRAGFADGAVWQTLERPRHWLFCSRESPEGPWRLWVVRRSDALVEEFLTGPHPGATSARILYHAYELFDQEPLPTDLEIHLAGAREVVRAKARRYRVNPPLKPQVFAPPRVDADHHFPLSQLRFTKESRD